MQAVCDVIAVLLLAAVVGGILFMFLGTDQP